MTFARLVALAAVLAIALVPHASGQLLARLSIERAIADLGLPDAQLREQAATTLAVAGPTERVVPELATALTGEAVPAVRTALVVALARRGDASAAGPLIAAWERASPTEREVVLDGLAAIDTREALAFLLDRIESELHRPGVCARLGRSSSGIAVVMTSLASPERRDFAALCLTQFASDERAASALIESAPTLARPTLAHVLDALDADPRAIPLATATLEHGDDAAGLSALQLLARHAPDAVPLERWRSLAAIAGVAQGIAIVALAQRDLAAADDALAPVVAADPASRAAVLDALVRAPSIPAHVLVPFVGVESTRQRALDRLAELPDGAEILAGLTEIDGALRALAVAAAVQPAALVMLRARIATLDPARRRDLLAVAGAVDTGACGSGESVVERRSVAFCLSRAHDGGSAATRLLETEREPTVVAWLALATDAAPSIEALDALLEERATRLAVLHLVPHAMRRASPPEARRLRSVLVHAARATRGIERAEALRALGALGDVRHRALIARALDDDEPVVRIAAARALTALPTDPVSEIRRAGRARIEHHDDVRAALVAATLAPSVSPLRVRVDVHGGAPDDAEVELTLADGRALVLAPVSGEIVLFGVPDRGARVRLVDPERD